MAKPSKAYICQSCGAVATRWSGKCAACGEWNTLIEEAATPAGTPALVAIKGGKGRQARFETLDAKTEDAPRLKTGIAELDRVLGGGLVPGAAVLVGGDPGIGKSTLLLQAAAELAERQCHLPLGREATAQVRCARGLALLAPVALGTETNVANIIIRWERTAACPHRDRFRTNVMVGRHRIRSRHDLAARLSRR